MKKNKKNQLLKNQKRKRKLLKPDLFIILLKFDTNNFLLLFYEHFIKQIQFTDLIIRNYSQYSWILDVSSNNKYMKQLLKTNCLSMT